MEDERLLGGLPSKGGSPVWAEEVDKCSAAGLMGLLGGRWLEKEAVQRIKEAGMASWCTVGMLLCAMADGHDALSEEEAVRKGTASHSLRARSSISQSRRARCASAGAHGPTSTASLGRWALPATMSPPSCGSI